MAKENLSRRIRINIMDDETHDYIRVFRFRRPVLVFWIASLFIALFVAFYFLIAYTPMHSLIPGYPDKHTQRAAISNALKIDSLQEVVSRWVFYSENLRRVVEGEDPVSVASVIREWHVSEEKGGPADPAALKSRDSLLRSSVSEAEKFVLDERERNLPIEGKLFFPPARGVVASPFRSITHPYLELSLPRNSAATAVLDGTVFQSSWDDAQGYTIMVWHEGEIISIYRNCLRSLCSAGDKVRAGMPLAIASSREDSIICFELWYKGEAINPEKYISF